ncbi:MAG: OmpA family protein [Actinomycetales bacterium]|nr:OmpA family protein [Actinomycetales bacterium]
MRLVGRGDDADPLGLTEKQALILQSERPRGRSLVLTAEQREQSARKVRVAPVAQATGSGFLPGSPVKFYLLPSTYLGQLINDGSGAFAGDIPVPPGLTPGTYTLQMNGLSPTSQVRSLSIGVVVKPTSVTVGKVRAKVYFDALSPLLDDAAKATLRKVARKARAGSIRSVVVGYVQPTDATANDVALSTARARAVAAYLRSRGVTGAYVVRGDGRAAESGVRARRVNLSITFQR